MAQAMPIAIGFFALNPAAVYAVGYLVQRSILLATFFVVLGLWLFARAAGGGRRWLYAAALVAYALAVLSKEHAVLAPLVAIPVYIVVARPDRARFVKVMVAAGAIIALAATGLFLRYGDVIGTPFETAASRVRSRSRASSHFDVCAFSSMRRPAL